MAQNESNAQKELISVPDSGDYSKRGKGKMIADLLKRCVDVEDLAAERISIPACLVEPVPSLEYWGYLDRPDLFVAINDSQDQLQRMLSVIRFCFSKDLKLTKGEPFKPYDSFRGEFFRAHFDVPANAVSFASTDSSTAPLFSWHLDKVEALPSPVILHRNGKFGAKSPRRTSAGVKEGDGPSGRPRVQQVRLHNTPFSKKLHKPIDPGIHHRVVFLKEKVSDNPSISAYWFECLKKGVEASGVDHISASTDLFGNTIEIAPGSQNKGIFLRIKKGPGSGESYRVTHPKGVVEGFISGHTSVVITDSKTVITCSGGQGKQLQTIIEYKETSSRPPKCEVEGIVFTYEEGLEHEAWTKVLQVPNDLVVATFEGCWKGAITWKRPDSDSTWPLIDLSLLAVVPKRVRHVREQLPNESRRFWNAVTTNILEKNFSEATRTKQATEQEQQALSKTRKEFGIQSDTRYFKSDISSGAPTLSFEGRRVLMEETHILHKSSTGSTEESPIQHSHEPVLAESPKNLVDTVNKVFTRMKSWAKRGERLKDPIEDDRKPLPKGKKAGGGILSRRGGRSGSDSGSGSGSGSAELAYSVGRGSGSGAEFTRGLSRSGSRSSRGDNASVFKPHHYSESESHSKLYPKAPNRSTGSWGQRVGQPPRQRTSSGAAESPSPHNRESSISNSRLPDSRTSPNHFRRWSSQSALPQSSSVRRYSYASSFESMPDSTNEAQRQLAAKMGHSATAMPRPNRTPDEKGIYPSHMLPSSPNPKRSERPTMAPFSSYEDPYAPHHYRPPIRSPRPSSISTTSGNSAESPPPSPPRSPTRQVYNVAPVYGHGHGRRHSLSTNLYAAADYASTNGVKLLPRQPTKRHTQQYTSSYHSGLGAVGPALAQNIPPVLPRPPSLKGSSSSSYGLGRRGRLGRSGTARKGDVKTITDEEQAAYAALNTYR